MVKNKLSFDKTSSASWTISQDFAKILIEHIKKTKPKVIIELGSGLSTGNIAYLLKESEQSLFISLEHDIRFYATTHAHLKAKNLHKKVNLILAPLKTYTIHDKQWQWYDLTDIRGLRDIDMLIIDGPPGYIQTLSRYPALPLLYKHLNNTVSIFLDDAKRNDEKEIIMMWKKEFPDLKLNTLDTQKGTAVFIR